MKTHTKMFKSSLYGEKNNVVSLGKRSIKMYENKSGMERNGVFHLLPSNVCDIKYEMNKKPRATRKTTKTCLPSHACTRYESRKRQPHSYSQYTQNYAKIQRRMQTIPNEFRRADTTTVNRIFIAHLHTMRSTFGMRGFAILFV